jgi:hypothetical protein
MPRIDTENPELSFVNIILKIDGDEVTAKSVSYSDSVERAMKRGNHPVPLGMTQGEYSPEASLTLYRSDFDPLLKKYGTNFYTKGFTVVVQYAYVGGDTVQDELIGCRWKKRESGGSQGSDALEVSSELDLLYIKWNGQDPWPKMPQAQR